MAKKFTYKASEATLKLFSVQTRLHKARALVTRLEVEERGFKAFLLDYYDLGRTPVEYQSGSTLEVLLSEFEMEMLDQEKAKRIILRAGKRIPYVRATVTKLKISKRKGK